MTRAVPLLLALALLLGACSSPAASPDGDGGTAGSVAGEGPAAPTDATPVAVAAPAGVTADGVVDLGVPATELAVGPGVWVLGVPTTEGAPAWVVVAPDGTSTLVTRGDDGPEVSSFEAWDPAHPPVLVPVDGAWRWPSTQDAGPDAGIAVGDDGTRVVVDVDGALRVGDVVVPGPFLPDARPVPLPDGSWAVLADPTDVYGHGVLGDAFEAGSLAVVTAGGEVALRLEAPGRVIEGLAPLVGDVDGDGEPELVVTTSADADGARIEAWSLDGQRRLVGPAIGASGRWRHMIAVAPAVPGGGAAVVEVVTPHAAHVAQWLVATDGALTPATSLDDAVVSHAIGLRNLQRAAVVDVDGDGIRDLVAPSTAGDGLAVVSLAGSAPVAVEVGLGAAVSSNLALAGGGADLALAVVTDDGVLHVWG